jgi:uncharacterized membrane protein YgcG
MRAPIVTALLLAVCAVAQDYPKPNGFVNDFANQLPLEAVQSLEKKVRDYQRATGNQIGVAVVPSLNGTSIEDYSLGLFRAWGVGVYGVNNGALFVWAPKERKLRIEVGRGLESVLTNAETSRILAQVRTLFRASKYEEGVNAAVDGIIGVLGPGASGSAATQQAPQPAPVQEAPPTEEGGNVFLIALGVAVALGVGMWLMVRRKHAAKWSEELPRQLAEADAQLTDAERKRAEAQVAFTELRREAPAEVCQRSDDALNAAPDTLNRLRSTVDELRRMPMSSYGELKLVHNRLRQCEKRIRSTSARFEEVRDTLDTFRRRRADAQQMLQELPSKLTRMEADGVAGSAEGLLQAAAQTYGQALQESQRTPTNWLLAYELLSDVAACLDQIENPTRSRYRPVRYWDGDIDSPAALAMEAMYISQMQSQGGGGGGWDSSSSSGFDSGSSGGGFDSGGGFGGGDSGGGGSSSDY